MTEQQHINEKIANAIKDFLMKHHLSGDCRIYFNNKCYHFDSSGKLEKVIEDIVPTDYFEYANNETVSLSYEGAFYNVMNYAFSDRRLAKLEQKFNDLVESFGYYAQPGHAWNLTLYKI